MSKSYQKEYRDNITDEQEQKRREAIRQYQKKYRDNMTDEQKQKRREANRRYQKKYRDNMSDEQKQVFWPTLDFQAQNFRLDFIDCVRVV